MDVEVAGYAWLQKSDLTSEQVVNLQEMLTVHPRKAGDYPGDPPEPVPLYANEPTRFGMPREFFFDRRRPVHTVDLQVTEGADDWWPAEFVGTLRPEQQVALNEVVPMFRAGRLGGIVQAKPGWGKTVVALAIAAELRVPTLVVVHKEFLMDQWMERIQKFLPAAKIGRVQQDECDFEGKTIVMGMVHSLGSNQTYPDELWDWPGLIIVDECHRIGARTWAPVPPRFKAKYRLGFTATPRRKDGADDAFWLHIGPIIFAGKEERLTPVVKRVWSKFKLVKTDRFNPHLAPRSLLLRFLCASRHRNDMIVDQLLAALTAGRKILVLSERLNHLQRLEEQIRKLWPMQAGDVSIGQYVGGRTKQQLARSAEAKVIFATVQYAAEGLDIPALDTLFLTTPMSDVEQAVGRIQRPFDGKKQPIVVDFRDDAIPMFENQGRKRERFYNRLT
jgi:superfamily II DNA or RNA helicase